MFYIQDNRKRTTYSDLYIFSIAALGITLEKYPTIKNADGNYYRKWSKLDLNWAKKKKRKERRMFNTTSDTQTMLSRFLNCVDPCIFLLAMAG